MGKAVEIRVSERQQALLEKWVRLLNVDRQRPRRWRRRWAQEDGRLEAAEEKGASDRDLDLDLDLGHLLADVLNDRDRPGGPPTFSAEQLTRIIAVACEKPDESDRPVTHWTPWAPRELVGEVVKRGIVDSISPRHIDRLLKRGDLCPHKSQY